MPGHEHHALVHHLIGHGHGLLRVAGVVAKFQPQLLPQHAAGGVDIRDGHLGARLHLLAERGILAGQGTGGGDHNFRLGRRGAQSQSR